MSRTLHRMAGLLGFVAALVGLAGCDVHEWPEPAEKVQFRLKLTYATDMTEWGHTYDGSAVTETNIGPTSESVRSHGTMRYIVRAYPRTGSGSNLYSSEGVREFTFTRSVSDGYDCEADLWLEPGDYDLAVWSDMTEAEGDTPFYDAGNFSEITLQGEHEGNNDWRDAFRGEGSLRLVSDYMERQTETVEVEMGRPLAKFEFVTTDLVEFMKKEAVRLTEKVGASVTGKQDVPAIDLGNYTLVFGYVGFMPSAYSVFSNEPVDSSTGVAFASYLERIDETEASLGFDYVFVNGKETATTLRIALYDKDGELLSLTDPIRVPLKRSRHTVIRGSFLMQKASGGVSIDPAYDGDYNIIFRSKRRNG